MEKQLIVPDHSPNVLLEALWRSQDLIHFLGTLDKGSRKFSNVPVKSAAEASNFALAYSAMGLDAYHACGEYASADSRTANNAAGAWALWLDIDVSPEKAIAGKGYATQEEAKTALTELCMRAKIPEPTHLVASGSGLHVYWALTTFLERQAWLQLAKKFKALTQALGLHADPARTSDIASVLRPPDTLNFKTNPPKPVTLIAASNNFIETEVMTTAIQTAFDKHCGAIDFEQPTEAVTTSPATTTVTGTYIEPPNFAQLTSALKVLDPDCDEFEWSFHRIAPMANTADEFPEIADRLYQLAKDWSSGELRGIPSKKWVTPGGNGLTGAQLFDRVWNRFLKETYNGRKAKLATIFFHAKQAGWVWNRGDFAQGGDETSQ